MGLTVTQLLSSSYCHVLNSRALCFCIAMLFAGHQDPALRCRNTAQSYKDELLCILCFAFRVQGLKLYIQCCLLLEMVPLVADGVHARSQTCEHT